MRKILVAILIASILSLSSIVSAASNQQQENQDQQRQDQLNQDKHHQDQLNKEQQRQDQLNRDKLRNDQLNRDNQRQNQLRRHDWSNSTYSNNNWRRSEDRYDGSLPFRLRENRDRYNGELINDGAWNDRFPGLRSYRWRGDNFWYMGRHITNAILFYDDSDELVGVGFMYNGVFVFLRDDNSRYDNHEPSVLLWLLWNLL